MKNIRRQQGELIDQTKGSIKKLDESNYVVNSQSGKGSYHIDLSFVCSCADHMYRYQCNLDFSIVTTSPP
jgi:hypothetical protein